jgi:hypothetical protein
VYRLGRCKTYGACLMMSYRLWQPHRQKETVMTTAMPPRQLTLFESGPVLPVPLTPQPTMAMMMAVKPLLETLLSEVVAAEMNVSSATGTDEVTP